MPIYQEKVLKHKLWLPGALIVQIIGTVKAKNIILLYKVVMVFIESLRSQYLLYWLGEHSKSVG